jgi:acyl-CoA-binding protein
MVDQKNTTSINIVDLKFENPKLENIFKLKAEKLKSLNVKMDNETKLKFYGLFKVATVGKYDEKNKISGGLFDFEAKYKKYVYYLN